MDMKNILIFALIGAVCMLVVTGGYLSMSNVDPDTEKLAMGAALGGAIGSAVSYFTGAEVPEPAKIMAAMTGGSLAGPEMKIGLPTF
jgi:hypothetical protein